MGRLRESLVVIGFFQSELDTPNKLVEIKGSEDT
jgi:hypothetical protein